MGTRVTKKVEVLMTLDLPHPLVDDETVEQVIHDAIVQRVDVIPRWQGDKANPYKDPMFNVSCEVSEIEDWDDDRDEGAPKEFSVDCAWWKESYQC